MTLAKRVIPCLDVSGGRVVKGVAFVDLRDAGDPAELASRYDEDGADEIVFLDITASSDERAILLEVVRRTADRVFIPLTVGGGVRSVEDIDALLRAGADKVSLNTAALDGRRSIDEAAQLRLAVRRRRIDAREPRVATGALAWRPPRHRARRGRLGARGRRSWRRRGADHVDGPGRDRFRLRPRVDRAVAGAVAVPVIASGGAGEPEHLRSVLAEGGADAALAASIFHFDAHPIPETKRYLREHGVEVRL